MARDAYVEYIPDALIPHAGARLEQELVADVEAGGRLIAAELVAPGRVARDEAFDYASLSLTTRVRVDGREAAVDSLTLSPGRLDPRSPGLLGGHQYLASLFAIAPGEAAEPLAAAISNAVAGTANCTIATGTLPSGAGALIRVLADSGIAADRGLRTAWSAARVALLGSPPPRRRK